MFELTGKVAVVTGGNGGIGLGMARGLASAGAKVMLAGRNEEKSRAAVSDIEQRGGDAASVSTDVADEKSVTAMVAATIERFGRLDILVNNSGINRRGMAQDLSTADWHAVLDTNLTGAFFCARAVYPYMKQAGGGKIINIGSMMSIFGSGALPAYAASKGGIVQLTKSLACGWAKDNIQVNAVLPGWIDTELTRGARQYNTALHDYVLARTPAKRWGTIDDMSGIGVFLASPASDFVTGAAIPVDGGYASLG